MRSAQVQNKYEAYIYDTQKKEEYVLLLLIIVFPVKTCSEMHKKTRKQKQKKTKILTRGNNSNLTLNTHTVRETMRIMEKEKEIKRKETTILIK